MTVDICDICYEKEDIVQADKIKKNQDIGDKIPLLVYRYCFDKKFEIPCSCGHSNVKQKNDQVQRTKKRQLDEHVEGGHRKGGVKVI